MIFLYDIINKKRNVRLNMDNNIIEIFKFFFLDKKFIQSITAVIVAIMTFLVVPEDFVIVSKLGGTMFILFVSGIIFLAIELITFFSNKIRKLLISRQNKKYLNRIKESEYQEVLENLWTIVDSMSVSDQELLRNFLRNGNQPYIHNGARIIMGYGYSLLESDWVYKSEFKEETELEENNDEFMPFKTYNYRIRQQFILKPHIYNALKYSQKHYGRISHFD